MSMTADTTYIASVETHMLKPFQECIVILLLSVHAARSLWIWERDLSLADHHVVPFSYVISSMLQQNPTEED